MTQSLHLLEAHSLSKRFGLVPVLKKLSVSFSAGERVLLLGANGAGKSTLLRIFSGLSRPDSGTVKKPPGMAVGFVSHHLFLYSRLSVIENLNLFAPTVSRIAIDDALSMWGLDSYATRQVCELSKGNQVKVSIVRALISKPSVILLDEPSSNLDERATATLREALITASDEHGQAPLCITATHDIHRLASIGTRVVVMGEGRVVSDSGPAASQERLSDLLSVYREANR
jgi:ABC-type multidrug transport system ATPase subunit